MIRRYQNSILNLSKVVKIDLNNNKLLFTLQSRDTISGSFMFFYGRSNKVTYEFNTKDEAVKEFNEIKDAMSQYYKNK